mgnify:CR=1 FL=1
MYDYGHRAFEKLRDIDGITPQMIRKSLDPKMNIEKAYKAGESTGKSGSFFFFSADQKFIVKTMFNEEMKIFMENLDKYFMHLEKNPDSLISRIYGIF